MTFDHLELETVGQVGWLWLNRPDKLNAISDDMWDDIPRAVRRLAEAEKVRVIVVAGRGSAFTVGIDLALLASLGEGDVTSEAIYGQVKRLQTTISCFADTPVPVIAAVHGYCLGAGTNLISACDLRIANRDATFSIRETKMGLVADIGALQRLPGIIGSAATSEMAFTGSDYDSSWALSRGLVSEVTETAEQLWNSAGVLANAIAANSPLVATGIKRVLQANSGRSIEESLEFVARWNAEHLISNDLFEAMAAHLQKRPPNFTGT